MSRQFTRDFLIEVKKNKVPGHSMVHKFGRNAAVPNGSWGLISLGGMSSFNLVAGTTVRVKAGGDAADDAAGAGARQVTVQGIIAGTFIEDTEVLTLAGASASAAGSKSFVRIHRAWVSSAGTYASTTAGGNTAAITIENSAGTQDLIQISAVEGQTMHTGFTIPTGYTGYLLSAHIGVASGKTSNLRLTTRESMDVVAAPFTSKRVKKFWTGVVNQADYKPRGPDMVLPAKTDIWIMGYGDGAASQVEASFELLLVDNTYLV